MDRYNVLQAIPMSFYSKKLYRDVAQNWGGKVFFYLLFVLALTWIYPTFIMQRDFRAFVEVSAEKVVPQIPVMTVKEGKLSTPESRPYKIVDPATEQVVMVVDTSGTITSLADAKSPVLITADNVLIKKDSNEERSYALPKELSGVIDATQLFEHLSAYLSFLWIPIFIFALVSSFIYRFIQAMVYAILGKLFSAIFRCGVNYMQIIQIGMVSITPVLVVCAIERALKLHVPHMNWYYFGLAILYMFYGIVVNKNSKGEPKHEAPSGE